MGSRHYRGVLLLLLVLLARCEAAGTGVWVSTRSGRHVLIKTGGAKEVASIHPGRPHITIQTNQPGQVMLGFGAAMTEASGFLISQAKDRNRVLAELFDSTNGIGISMLRIPVGATDFSTALYSCRDAKDAPFSVEREKQVLFPLVRDALRLNPALKVIACPWSAPGWMKDNDSMLGVPPYLAKKTPEAHEGPDAMLRDECIAPYADYLADYVAACRAEGLALFAVSLQNEPLHTTEQYPSMHLPVSQAAQLVSLLGRRLSSRKLGTRILVWEHNYTELGTDGSDYVRGVYANPAAGRYAWGSAWHGYSGDARVMQSVAEAYPGKAVLFTEVTGERGHGFHSNLRYFLRDQFFPALDAGAQALLAWNLCVDQKGGPRLATVKWKDASGLLIRDTKKRSWSRSGEYAAVGHFSKFVKPGARRLESTGNNCESLSWSAFRNPDNSIVLVLFSDRLRSVELGMSVGESVHMLRVAGGSAVTVVMNPGP